jgi:membrane-associated phospholipid phosphatase
MHQSYDLKPFDIVNLLYYFFIIGLVIVFSNQIYHALFLIFSYTFIIIIVFWVILKRDKGYFLSILRYFYPIVFLGFIFESLAWIVPFIQPKNKDTYLIKLDDAIFSKPVADYLLIFNKPIFNDIFAVSYTFYYFMPLILLYYLYKKQKLIFLEYSLFALSLAYYISYIGYILLPAIGPRYSVVYSEPIHAGVIYSFIYAFLDKFEHIKQDCFPSGHVAISVLTNMLIFDINKKVGYLIMPLVILLIVATLALRFHYGVDDMAGLILAFFSYFVSKIIYKKKLYV